MRQGSHCACRRFVWRRRGYVLKQLARPAHFDSALIANGATGLSSDDLGSGYHWRLQDGYRFNPNFAVEGGHIDFGKADDTASYSGGRAQGSLKAGGVDLAALLLHLSTTVSLSSASWAARMRRSTPL